MNLVCHIYGTDFRDLADFHTIDGMEKLAESVYLLLCHLPYIWIHQSKLENVRQDVF